MRTRTGQAMSNNAFDREYREWLQKLEVNKADSVWGGIEDQLDLIETWDRINTGLDRVQPQRRKIIPLPFLRIMEVAAAILILVMIPLFFLKHQNNTISTVAEQRIPETDSPGTVPVSPETATDPSSALTVSPAGGTAVSGEAIQFHDGTALPPGRTAGGIPETTESEKTDRVTDISRISGTAGMETIIAGLRETVTGDFTGLVASVIETTAPPKKSSGPFIRFQDAGLMYSYKNTWLLNYETRNGLNPSRLGNILPTFHHDLGITSTIVFREKHDIGLEVLLMSETGQNYQQYINASFVNRKITLNYFKLQTWYMWNHRKIPGSTIAGVYFARLGMAEEIQGDLRFSVRDDYRNYDYGLVLGYRLDVPLFSNIVMYPGIRFNYNLMNIFEGHAGTMNIFKTTNNFTAGVNVTFAYSFR
ncbi:MAG TPA: hypothetical protein PLM01_12830 [Bacteroidales bacterium]|nr:hypothetical protein [Bacteroidales bacterium]